MSRGASALLLALALAFVPAPARAARPLGVDADVHFDRAVQIRLTVANRTTGALRALRPELRYRHATRTGAAADLPPGASHEWAVEFPLPPGPSGDALVVMLHFEDAAGRARSEPWARSVDTPGLLPTEAEMIADASGQEARIRIVDATGDPLRGQLVALVPEECFTDPVAQPVDVPPRTTIAVPIRVQDCGFPVGTEYSVFATLHFVQGGIPRTVATGTVLAAGTRAPQGAVNPLLIGAASLGLAIGLLALANGRARRRRASLR